MGVTTLKVYEYGIQCDRCGFVEVYHTGDTDNGVRVHSEATAIRAARFHERRGQLLCPTCTEAFDNEAREWKLCL